MRRPLLLVLLLLGCPSWAWAQAGFLQAVPGTPRPTCPSIPAPVKNQTWCADASNGPGSYLWKVWNGVSYVTVGGGGGSAPGLPFQSIQFNDSGVFGGDAEFTWNKTTNTLAIPAGQYLSTATAGVSPNNISRFTHPGDLVEPVLGNMLIQSATTPATDKHVVLGSFDMLSTTGSFASGKAYRDRVALYSGITAVGGAQSGNIWSYNSDTTQEPASGNYFAIGAEIDFTNNNVDRGDADGEIGLSGFFSAPIFVDSLSTKRSTAFIFLSGLNSPKMWNRGVVICCDAISSTGSAFQDLTNGDKSVDIRGTPNYGIFQATGGVRNYFGGDVQLVGSSLQMFEPTYTFHVDIGASVALAQNMLYLWPSVPGTFGQVLTTDGSLGFQTLSWTTVSGGSGTVGPASATQIAVFDGATSVTGYADFIWDEATRTLTAAESTTLSATPLNVVTLASKNTLLGVSVDTMQESAVIASLDAQLLNGASIAAIIASSDSIIGNGVSGQSIIAAIVGAWQASIGVSAFQSGVYSGTLNGIGDSAVDSSILGGNNNAIGNSCTSCVIIGGEFGAVSTALTRAVSINSAQVLTNDTVGIGGTVSVQPGSLSNGQSANIKTLTEELTILAAANTDTAFQFPAGSTSLGCTVRVTTVIPAPATTFDTGVSGATTRYASGTSVAATSTGGSAVFAPYASATSVRITPDAVPGAATGKVRVTCNYIDMTPPTS